MRRKRILCHIINMFHSMTDDEYLNELNSLYDTCYKHKDSLIHYHAMKMGRQDFCFTDERGYRFWVWQYPEWSVYVSNRRGINFMVQPELAPEEVTRAFNDYLQLVL